MSSITKDRGRNKNYIACFTAYLPHPHQLKRSTCTTDRRLAYRLSYEYEECAQGRGSRDGIQLFLESIQDFKVQRAARKVFDDILKRTTGEGLSGGSTRAFVVDWLQRIHGEVAPTSFAKYEKVSQLFLESLGPKAEGDIAAVRSEDVIRFRNQQSQRISVASVNGYVKIVRMILNAAEADGLVTRNEAKHIRKLKDATGTRKRRPFTLDEVQTVLKNCTEEWRSMVLFGIYTGARLGDVASLTWQNVDLDQKELRFQTKKTGRRIVMPLAEPLVAHLQTMEAGDDPRQPLHPRAYRIFVEEGRTGTLSRQFREILADAGLVSPSSHHTNKSENGRAGKRDADGISFHSLRHAHVSLLKNAGVSDAVAKDLVGHESDAVSAVYTHISIEAKRKAVESLPKLDLNA